MEAWSHSEHDQIFFFRDRRAGLRAIVALHDVSKGLAMGGTRLRPYPTLQAALQDAMQLSRHMSLKARCAGLPIGGAKGVIIADPTAKTDELLASYAGFVHRLGGLFVTGQDMNLSRQDVEFLRLQTPYIAGVREDCADPSAMTALGVLVGIKAALKHVYGDESLRSRTVAVQGVGATGQELCRLLALGGAGLIVADPDPIRADAMRQLYGALVVTPQEIVLCAADVLSLCAGGSVLGGETIDQLRCAIVAGSANNQLVSEDEDAERLRRQGVLYCPDFVINAGGLIEVFCEQGDYDAKDVLRRVTGIGATLTGIFTKADADGTSTLAAAKAGAAQPCNDAKPDLVLVDHGAVMNATTRAVE